MLGMIRETTCSISAADLAVPQREGKEERLRMLASKVARLERDIDTLNAEMAPLDLVSGSPAARGSAYRIGRHHRPQGAKDHLVELAPAGGAGQRGWYPVYEPAVGLPCLVASRFPRTNGAGDVCGCSQNL